MLIRRAEHRLPHAMLGQINMLVYEAAAGDTVIVVRFTDNRRSVTSQEPLIRIQCACRYSEIFRATDCDCSHQINASFYRFLVEGEGILIHLDQEGRGAGLVNKAKSYEVQQREDIDTVAAYQALGFSPDSREYGYAVDVLHDLGIESIRLLTNNPRKIDALRAAGLSVSRERLLPLVTEDNSDYLRVKQEKLGHDLQFLRGTSRWESNDESNVKCFVVGAAAMDHVFELETNPELGTTRQAKSYERRAGGKGLNQAIALARLGAEVSLLTVRAQDADSDQIAGICASERVTMRAAPIERERPSPQTAVLQPHNSAPTYVGYLGEEHRTLRKGSIDACASEIAYSDVVFITLEASGDAITQTVEHVSDTALVVLNASPRIERPYSVATRTLERVDVVIGSERELHELLASDGGGTGSWESAEDMARELAEVCGLTVVMTSFRSQIRYAVAVSALFDEIVEVTSPRVRLEQVAQGLSTAVGNGDVFCAAFGLYAMALIKAREDNQTSIVWSGENSPLGDVRTVVDILMRSIQPEAWVTGSKGGYENFPVRGPSFEQWCLDHPARFEGWRGKKQAGNEADKH